MTHSDNQTGSIADTARKAAEDLKETGKEALQGAKSVMGSTMSDLKAGATAKAEEVRETIADEGERMASSLRDAAGQQGGSVQGRVLETMASGVTAVSDSLRSRDVSALFADIQSYARRNPAIFVAGAAAAGLLLARFAAQASRSAESSTFGEFGRSASQSGDMGAGYAKGGMGGQNRASTSGQSMSGTGQPSGMIDDPIGSSQGGTL